MSSKLKWRARSAWAALAAGLVGWLLLLAFQDHGPTELEQLKARLLADGETLDFPSLLSPPIPDEENFCAIPALAGIAWPKDSSPDGLRAEQMREEIVTLLGTQPSLPAGSKATSSCGLTTGEPTDFSALAAALRKEGKLTLPPGSTDAAHEVLAAWSDREEFFGKLTAGLARKRAQWTPALRNRLRKRPWILASIPHVSVSLRMVQALASRGVAAAQTGNGRVALESWQIISRIQQAANDEPLLINLLISEAMQSDLDSIVWQMAAARLGTVAEWREMERHYARVDGKAAALRSFRGERATGADAIEYYRDHRSEATMLLGGSSGPGGTGSGSTSTQMIAGLVPGGIFEANESSYLRLQTDFCVTPLRDQSWPEALARQAALEKQLQDIRSHPWLNYRQMLAAFSLTSVTPVMQRLIYAQAYASLVTIACRLESCRIEQGSYPESLAGLTLSDGSPLPLDPLNGKPVGYRKTANGRYALWCVGPDLVDDGGTRGPAKEVRNSTYRGDWVWDFQGVPGDKP